MPHRAIIQAQNSNSFKVLSRILSQWNDFIKTIESFPIEQQKTFLNELIIDNKLIEPFSTQTPLFYVLNPDIITLMDLNQPCTQVYDYIEKKLFELNHWEIYAYNFRGDDEYPVYLFVSDKSKISNHLKKRIRRLPAPI